MGVGGRHRLLYLPKYYIKHGGGKTESGLKLLKHTYHFLLEVSPVEAGLVWSLELPQLGCSLSSEHRAWNMAVRNIEYPLPLMMDNAIMHITKLIN